MVVGLERNEGGNKRLLIFVLSHLKLRRTMIYNINARCRVKLTKYGRSILYDHCHNSQEAMNILYTPDSAGYTYFELWNVMNIFGTYLYMGNNNIPFENNNIEIIEEK